MKKNVFNLIFLFISMSTFCQEMNLTIDSLAENKNNLGICFAPSYCFRSFLNKYIAFTEKAGTDDYQWIYYNKNWDIPKWGYTLGLSHLNEISKRTRLEISILFENYGYKTNQIDTIFIFHEYGPGLLVSDTLLDAYKLKFNAYFISLPITCEFNFYKHKNIIFYFGGGLSPSILMKEIEIRDKKYDISNGIRFFATSNLGVLIDDFLLFQPFFNYSLSPLGKEFKYGRHLYSFGLSVKYNFN